QQQHFVVIEVNRLVAPYVPVKYKKDHSCYEEAPYEMVEAAALLDHQGANQTQSQQHINFRKVLPVLLPVFPEQFSCSPGLFMCTTFRCSVFHVFRRP